MRLKLIMIAIIIGSPNYYNIKNILTILGSTA